MLQEPKSENFHITTIRTSSGPHLRWKKHFHKNPFQFRIYAAFEADNEIDKSNTGKKKQLICISKIQ